jgi:hypothetical protein
MAWKAGARSGASIAAVFDRFGKKELSSEEWTAPSAKPGSIPFAMPTPRTGAPGSANSHW